MLEKECQLCGGRVVEGRCVECGMYQKQDAGRYYLNEQREIRSKGEAKIPEVTQPRQKQQRQVQQKQIQQRQTQPRQEQQRQTQQRQEQQRQIQRKQQGQKQIGKQVSVRLDTEKKTSGNSVVKWLLGVFLVFVLSDVIFSVLDHEKMEAVPEEWAEASSEEVSTLEIENSSGGSIDGTASPLPVEGQKHTVIIRAGEYEVGAHLPAGTYQITAAGCGAENMEFHIEKPEEDIYASFYLDEFKMDEENSVIMDVNLHPGVELKVLGAGEIIFHTENAQMSGMKMPKSNPITEEFRLEGEVLEAGIHFEPGIYDVMIGNGNVDFRAIDPQGYEFGYFFSDSPYDESHSYENLKIEEGTRIQIDFYEEGEMLIFQPSSTIFEEP